MKTLSLSSVVVILLRCVIKDCLAASVVNLNTGPVIHGMISTFNCTVTPKNVTVNTMTLSRVSAPSSIIYAYYPGNSADGPDPQYANRISGGFIAADLTLSVAMNTTLSDSGMYRCHTVTSEGPQNVNKIISVLYLPDIMLEKTSPGEFTCSSGPSFPQANLTWSCTGSAHCEKKDLTTTASSSVNGTFETVLTMTCVNNGTQDSTCSCETGHPFGAAKSVEIQAQVDPNITSSLENQTLTVGESYEINCEANGFPTPVIEWIKEATGDIVSNSSFFNISNAAVADSGWYICNASSSSGAYDYKKVFIQVNDSPTTTSRTSEVTSTSVPPDGEDQLVAVLVTLIIISFIGSLTLCIFVCIKFPDEKVSLKGVVDWICITLVFFCVILGNICGGVLWRMIDSNQNTGIIALEIILIDVGIFILGIVIGIIKRCIEQKPESDEALRDILVKLPNIVLSVATFGGVSAGISIAFSYKNGKVRHASITPEETQASPRKVTPTNSENSVTSQSKVPLQEDVSQNIQEKNDDIPMQKPKKKKKKKTEGKYKEPPIQKVATPRKLPPLKT